MPNAIIKQLMAYSLLVVVYLVVRRYIKVTPDPPGDPGGTNVDDTAASIIELTESMEYVRDHAFHIPESDKEALEEVTTWMLQAQDNLESLMVKYIQESRMDLTGKDFLEIQDRRGRKVRLSLQYKDVEEFPDEIGYKKQQEDLKNTNWDKEEQEL